MATSHAAVVVIADDGTSPVGSDEWNAPHVFTGVPRLITANLVVPAFESYVVSGDFEVAAGIVFELAAGATMEVL
jgi:hypothetical protein